MTPRTERDQVLFGVGSGMAAELSVVQLKIRHRATRLTPPAVATQDLLAQIFVRQGEKVGSKLPTRNRAQEDTEHPETWLIPG